MVLAEKTMSVVTGRHNGHWFNNKTLLYFELRSALNLSSSEDPSFKKVRSGSV